MSINRINLSKNQNRKDIPIPEKVKPEHGIGII